MAQQDGPLINRDASGFQDRSLHPAPAPAVWPGQWDMSRGDVNCSCEGTVRTRGKSAPRLGTLYSAVGMLGPSGWPNADARSRARSRPPGETWNMSEGRMLPVSSQEIGMGGSRGAGGVVCYLQRK